MISSTTAKFKKFFAFLPQDIQRQSRKAYKLFIKNWSHPSLHFKRIHQTRPIYSIRINLNYRAVGIMENEHIIWFWIGTHDEYERLIATF